MSLGQCLLVPSVVGLRPAVQPPSWGRGTESPGARSPELDAAQQDLSSAPFVLPQPSHPRGHPGGAAFSHSRRCLWSLVGSQGPSPGPLGQAAGRPTVPTGRASEGRSPGSPHMGLGCLIQSVQSCHIPATPSASPCRLCFSLRPALSLPSPPSRTHTWGLSEAGPGRVFECIPGKP